MSKLPKKKIIGITGSMGSGKSMVSSMIRKRFPVLDLDQVNRSLIEKGNKGYKALSRKLDIPFDKDRNIDKKVFSKRMFSDNEYKEKVERIIHPLILDEMKEWIDRHQDVLVFIEVPLLFETNMDVFFDEIWCVVCDEAIALQRLQTKRNYSLEEAKSRLACQYSPIIKLQQSDVVLYNNGTIEELEEQVSVYLERSLS